MAETDLAAAYEKAADAYREKQTEHRRTKYQEARDALEASRDRQRGRATNGSNGATATPDSVAASASTTQEG